MQALQMGHAGDGGQPGVGDFAAREVKPYDLRGDGRKLGQLLVAKLVGGIDAITPACSRHPQPKLLSVLFLFRLLKV